MKYILLLSLLAFLNCSWNGIDVSVWQGPNIDFKKVKAAGKNFVFSELVLVHLLINILNQTTKRQKQLE